MQQHSSMARVEIELGQVSGYIRAAEYTRYSGERALIVVDEREVQLRNMSGKRIHRWPFKTDESEPIDVYCYDHYIAIVPAYGLAGIVVSTDKLE